MDIKHHNFKKSKRQISYTMAMEQRLAAQWAGYTWQAFSLLPGVDRWIDPKIGGDSKSSVIVSYRRAKAIESIMMET